MAEGPKAAAAHRQAPAAGPCAMVIFGAGGDLTKRLLMPALYNLSHGHLLPDGFCIVGVDMADVDVDAWRASLLEMLKSFLSGKDGADRLDPESWNRLAKGMSYLKGDMTKPELYAQIGEHLEHVGGRQKTGGACLFYLAVADRFFAPVVENLGKAGLVKQEKDGPWRRVVIEKPFGHDLASARDLNARVLAVLDETQVYRIDHFLGKETVQNIMAFRFANGMFEPIWNRDRIDHVQITAAETVGVEKRGKFYEVTGALRDMVPNHVFQLLAMVAMEPPVGFGADAIRSKKADVFASMKPIAPDEAVRGQYGAGDSLAGYRDEPDVSPDSATETYVALKMHIDNWRWAGVPFYLRTGKRLARRTTEIAIRFKHAPYAPFEATHVEGISPNWLVLQIQPDEGISLQFEVKRPGPLVDLAPVRMNFNYSDWFDQEQSVGYETLIYDCMIGDQTLFQRADQVEAAWGVVQPVLDAWAAAKPGFPDYAAGGDGPEAADELLRADGGRAWRPGRAGRRRVSEASPSTIDIVLALRAMQIVAEGGLEPWVHTSAGWFVLDGSNDLVADEALRSGMEPVVVSAFTEEHLMHAVMITGASDDEAALAACQTQAEATLGGAAVVSRARPNRLDVTQVRA